MVGDVGQEFGIPTSTTVAETRKYALHRKIERNPTAAKQAKKFHGTVCQACDLDFSKRYGAIGKGFIEAHRLKGISTLDEGVAVPYDIAEDFAVLCSNCHRMIHRSADPSDLAAPSKTMNIFEDNQPFIEDAHKIVLSTFGKTRRFVPRSHRLAYSCT